MVNKSSWPREGRSFHLFSLLPWDNWKCIDLQQCGYEASTFLPQSTYSNLPFKPCTSITSHTFNFSNIRFFLAVMADSRKGPRGCLRELSLLPFACSRKQPQRNTRSSVRTWQRPSPSLTPSSQSWIQRNGHGPLRQTRRMKMWTLMVSAVPRGRGGWVAVSGVGL